MNYSREHVSSTTSTNDVLKENAANLEHFHFLRADYQSKGKGREHRLWQAQEGKNLLFSLLLKDPRLVAYGGKLSLYAAVAIAAVFEEEYGLEGVMIKWPNDIYIYGKKVAGILLEGQLPHYVVIGMGINVNQHSFQGDYRVTPTSLSLECGKSLDIDLLESKIEDTLYDVLEGHPLPLQDCLDYYKKHDFLLGKKGFATALGKEGVVAGVDEEFRLLLDVEGEIHHLLSGEIDFHR